MTGPSHSVRDIVGDQLGVFQPDHARTLRNDLVHTFEDATDLRRA